MIIEMEMRHAIGESIESNIDPNVSDRPKKLTRKN